MIPFKNTLFCFIPFLWLFFCAYLNILYGKTVLLTEFIDNGLYLSCPIAFFVAVFPPGTPLYTVEKNVAVNMLCIIMGGVQALEIIPKISLHKLLCDLHSSFQSYLLLFKRYDKVVALTLIHLSILPFYKKHFLQGGICVAVMASHQCACLRLFFVCNVGNSICKVHSHIFFSCLVDAGYFCDCDFEPPFNFLNRIALHFYSNICQIIIMHIVFFYFSSMLSKFKLQQI